MKLKDGFITHESDGEHILVSAGDTQFNGLVRSNKTAAFIVEQLKSGTTAESIVTALLSKYDVSKEVAHKDVERILDTLRSIGAIDE